LKLFIDTWGWITLSNRREARHRETTAFYRDFRNKKGESYTSEADVEETMREPYSIVEAKFGRKIAQRIYGGYLLGVIFEGYDDIL